MIAAPYPADNCHYGYVMRDCKITNLNEEGYSLGRSWGGKSKVAWIGTTMTDAPLNDGKAIKRFTVGGMNVAAYQFKEFGSKTEQGANLTPVHNYVTFVHGTGNFTYDTTMSADSASLFTLDKVFSDWKPAVLAAQVTSPTVTLKGKTLSWTAASGSIGTPSYAVFKDDELLTITNARQYALEEVVKGATYTVRVANEMGGFGPSTPSSTTTGLSLLAANDSKVVGTHYFYLDGTACDAQAKGVVLVVETMANGSRKSSKKILK